MRRRFKEGAFVHQERPGERDFAGDYEFGETQGNEATMKTGTLRRKLAAKKAKRQKRKKK
jgi:hypothetical protein